MTTTIAEIHALERQVPNLFNGKAKFTAYDIKTLEDLDEGRLGHDPNYKISPKFDELYSIFLNFAAEGLLDGAGTPREVAESFTEYVNHQNYSK